ncbi:hypothetical protein CIPAW_13G129600 [Carya illinoinensis]|uniref:Uncharacterized protein n=1 Tax=Carya illinoinensis TaxID=32201 RepID=A0A8T1NR89_CARIL|nr:hypothetical protein CIPAW_13G129600 [Carya illinoinensis]
MDSRTSFNPPNITEGFNFNSSSNSERFSMEMTPMELDARTIPSTNILSSRRNSPWKSQWRQVYNAMRDFRANPTRSKLLTHSALQGQSSHNSSLFSQVTQIQNPPPSNRNLMGPEKHLLTTQPSPSCLSLNKPAQHPT